MLPLLSSFSLISITPREFIGTGSIERTRFAPNVKINKSPCSAQSNNGPSRIKLTEGPGTFFSLSLITFGTNLPPNWLKFISDGRNEPSFSGLKWGDGKEGGAIARVPQS